MVLLISAWLISLMFRWDLLSLRVDRFFFVALVVGFFIQRARGRTRSFQFGALEFLMGSFATYCTISLIVAGSNIESGVGKNTQLNRLFNLTWYPYIFYVIVKHLRLSEHSVRAIIKVIATMGGYLALTAIFERFQITALVWPKYILNPDLGIHWGRSRGPFLQSVLLGLSLVFSIVTLCYLWATSNNSRDKLVLFLWTLVASAGIYLTNTRGVWLSYAASLSLLGIARTPLRRVVGLFCLVGVLAFLVGGASKFSVSGGTLFSKRKDTVEHRMVQYDIAWRMGVDHPIFGIGLYRVDLDWQIYYAKIGSPEFAGWDGSLHNEYLRVFAETGIVGFVLFAGILTRLARMGFAVGLAPHNSGLPAQCLALAALACLGCLMVSAIFADISSHVLQNAVVFGLFGMVNSNALDESAGTKENPEDSIVRSTTSVMAV